RIFVARAPVTAGYLRVWYTVGRGAAAGMAPAFLGARVADRLALALPAILRAARWLVWPLDRPADYNPQVIAAPATFGAAAMGGALVVVAVLALVSRRRTPVLAFAAALAALAYLPSSNLLF